MARTTMQTFNISYDDVDGIARTTKVTTFQGYDGALLTFHSLMGDLPVKSVDAVPYVRQKAALKAA